MLGGVYLAIEKYGRGNAKTVARRLNWLPAHFIQGLAKAKLVRTLRHVWRNSPMQRERWAKAGIRLKDLRGPEVLERLPFLRSEDLRECPEELFCVPTEELVHVIATSGTKGTAKRVYFTADDMAAQAGMIGTNLRRLPGASRVLTMYRMKLPTWPAGMVSWQGIVSARMLALLAGTDTCAEEQVRYIRDYRVNVIMGVPSYVHRVTLEGGGNLKELGVKYLLLSGQPWTEKCRQELEAAWGAKALDAYGTNECGCGISSECLEQDGLHVSEADFWLEIVDPVTGKVLEDGQEGDVVVTTLSRRGMPLVRYRIGDLASLCPREGRCRCGLAVRKMSRIKGRVDDMLFVGNGINGYPDEIDRAVLRSQGVTDYQLVIERDRYRDVMHLTVEVSGGNGQEHMAQEMWGALKEVEAIREAVDETKMVEFGRFQTVPSGALAEGRTKSVRIVDKRERDR